MIDFVLRIVLIVSLFFNVVLYFDWIDVGQYKESVDKLAENGKAIIESEEFQNLLVVVKEKFVEAYGKSFDEMKNEFETKVSEVGVEKATEEFKTKYTNISDAEIKTLADEAEKEKVN